MDNQRVLFVQKGEKLTFFQLFSEKKWTIEIPIIQRDYAQGRKSSQEIRETFLNALLLHLKTNQNIDLDFVYGSLSISDIRAFIPLDGQQRLTTLFLLHWYLAVLDNRKSVFDNSLIDGNKSNFRYETRTSSSEFCDALVLYSFNTKQLLPADNNEYNSLSNTIKDREWFFNSWEKDPTVQSILNMLDAINEKFKDTEGYFDKLTNSLSPIITFQFLNLIEFKLTDDLYIKMNSRGKQLSPFENFKAKFEQYILEATAANSKQYEISYPNGNKSVSIREYFSHTIDSSWADLFWCYRDQKENVFDTQIMNFIRVVITNHYTIKEKDESIENLKLLIGKEDPESKDDESSPITFFQYKNIGVLDESLIINIISLLDLIENSSSKIKHYLSGSQYFNEDQIFNDVIQNKLNYTERLRFYAFYQYLILNKADVGLESWMRVVFNLTENTIYNNSTTYSRSLKSLHTLLSHSPYILEVLSSSENLIAGFAEIQLTEERIKAVLFKRSESWRNAILTSENNGYFKGQIGFLLDFSGIEQYFKEFNNCDWSDEENSTFYNDFVGYSKKSCAIFNQDGLIDFPDFVWERALLTKGNYTLYANSNFSFLIDFDRDISWKRLLRDSNNGRRRFIKEIFDDDEFDISNVNKSLNAIVSKSTVTDWRRHFISLKEIIEYLGSKKFIRWEDAGEKISLLQKMRVNGLQKEYYSYAFYLQYLRGKDYSPFTRNWYLELSGDEEPCCAVLDDFKYKKNNFQLSFYYADDNYFEIFLDDTNEFEIPNVIEEIFIKHGFKPKGKYWAILVPEKGSFSFLKKVCSTLNDLVA